MTEHRDANLPIPRYNDSTPPDYPEAYTCSNEAWRHSLGGHGNAHTPQSPTQIPPYFPPKQEAYPVTGASAPSANPVSYPEAEHQSPGESTKERRTCGLRPLILLLIVVVLIAAMLGGVLGGVLGTRSKSKSSEAQITTVPGPSGGFITITVTPSQSTSAASTNKAAPAPTQVTILSKSSGGFITVTVSPSESTDLNVGTSTADGSSTTSTSEIATQTAPSTPFITAREQFKFSSIASVVIASPLRLMVIYLEETVLKMSAWGDNGWNYLGTFNPDPAPKAISPLAVVSWWDGTNDNLRLYYFDDNNNLIEYVGLCSGDGTDCSWSDTSAIYSDGVSDISGLAAVHFYDDQNTDQIRVYLESPENGMIEVAYSSGQWSSRNDFPNVFAGTSFAATIDSTAMPIKIKVYYRDQGASIQYIEWLPDGGWQSSSTVPVENVTAIDPQAPFAVSGYYLSDSSFASRLYVIPNDKHPIEITTDDAVSYHTWNDVSFWSDGDDSGGAIAAVGWQGGAGEQEARFYYSVNGAVQEMVLSGSSWSQGQTLES